MSVQKSQQQKTGFTIIETLLVLAIAAIILAIVMQAFPAIQRNSRNSARRQDVASILDAISDWQLKHSGNLPTESDKTALLQYTRLKYYDPARISIEDSPILGADPLSGGPSNKSPFGPGRTEAVEIHNYQKCNPNQPGGSRTYGAGYSDVVALFAVETSSSGAVAGQCKEL